ncbi:uncharacterized protein J3R85_012040 [Psidium guajava]|nr:uncharacterized protein J3R85_012040 [Psidium guajava]
MDFWPKSRWSLMVYLLELLVVVDVYLDDMKNEQKVIVVEMDSPKMPSDLALDCKILELDSIKATSPKEKVGEVAEWVGLINRFDLERDEELIGFVVAGKMMTCSVKMNRDIHRRAATIRHEREGRGSLQCFHRLGSRWDTAY